MIGSQSARHDLEFFLAVKSFSMGLQPYLAVHRVYGRGVIEERQFSNHNFQGLRMQKFLPKNSPEKRERDRQAERLKAAC
jgi:hypothetical protein